MYTLNRICGILRINKTLYRTSRLKMSEEYSISQQKNIYLLQMQIVFQTNKGKLKVEDFSQFKWNSHMPNRATSITQKINEEEKNNTKFKLKPQNQRKYNCKSSRRSPKSSLSVSKFKINALWNKSKSSHKNTKPSKSSNKFKKLCLKNQKNIELLNIKESKDSWGYSNLSEFVEKTLKPLNPVKQIMN